MKHILKFHKVARVAYISHLDLMRLLLRALRVCGLGPAYSEGFNPHPKMSLAAPLSLGFESICEYLEFETAVKFDSVDAIKSLNEFLPEGLVVTDLVPKPANMSKSLAALVESSVYEIIICNPPAVTPEEFLAKDEIIITKPDRKKGGVKTIDIKSGIINFELTRRWGRFSDYNCELSLMPGGQVNPLLLMEAYYANSGEAFDVGSAKVLRTKLVIRGGALTL
jgi:radical SAM-linked protein